jgi:uncharacterized membrane protein YqjE
LDADTTQQDAVTTQQRYAGSEDRPLGDVVQQISENASALVREEIELARAEIEQKIKRLARGAIAGTIAGFFVLLGLIFLFHAAAWGVNDLLDSLWAGFLIVAGALFVLAILGALFALRSFKAGAPPTPDQAIEEARLIREAIEHPEVQAASAEAEKMPE